EVLEIEDPTKKYEGHAYTMIVADAIARYKKSQGYQVYFQTGKLGISEHTFYRTSASAHKKKVQKIFTDLLEKGDIYLGKYQGNYCVTCEDYVSLSQSQNNFCSACQTSLKTIEEKAYFLRIGKYQKQLLEYWQKTDFLSPLVIKNELQANFLQKPLPDLCITRYFYQTKKYSGTIAIKDQEKEAIGEIKFLTIPEIQEVIDQKLDRSSEYVLEKLTGNKKEKKTWEIVQVIGKDIARFHGIY
ncbi:22304_t:CDS:2, partial [Gigaspora margarita]